MTSSEQDPNIYHQAETLAMFQRNGQQVLINMLPDLEMQSCAHYYGMVKQVVVEAPEPYVDINAEKVVMEYFTQKHRDAIALFSALWEAGEAVSPVEDAQDGVNDSFALMSAVEAELGVEHHDQTIKLNGMHQRIALAGISMTFGIGEPQL